MVSGRRSGGVREMLHKRKIKGGDKWKRKENTDKNEWTEEDRWSREGLKKVIKSEKHRISHNKE